MVFRKPIRSEVFPGSIRYLQTRMQRLESLYGCEWEVSDGSVLSLLEVRPDSILSLVDVVQKTNHLRVSWSVHRWSANRGSLGYAGIEAYEQEDGNTLVDFLDGYSPICPSSEHDPIGFPFEFICALIVEQVWPAGSTDKELEQFQQHAGEDTQDATGEAASTFQSPPSERLPTPEHFTTHTGSVTGPVHTGSGDIIYSASPQEETRPASQLPQLTLKLFQMERDPTHRDEIVFRQRSGPVYVFGLVLENVSSSPPAKGIRIDVHFWWGGGDTLQKAPQFRVPHQAQGWENEAVELLNERAAHLTFRGPDFTCFPGHPEKWGNFTITLMDRVNVWFRVTYKVSSAEPYTQSSGELRITLA